DEFCAGALGLRPGVEACALLCVHNRASHCCRFGIARTQTVEAVGRSRCSRIRRQFGSKSGAGNRGHGAECDVLPGHRCPGHPATHSRILRMSCSRVLFLLGITVRLALAHTGEPLEPHDWWTSWEFDPGIVLPLVIAALLYWRGARQYSR